MSSGRLVRGGGALPGGRSANAPAQSDMSRAMIEVAQRHETLHQPPGTVSGGWRDPGAAGPPPSSPAASSVRKGRSRTLAWRAGANPPARGDGGLGDHNGGRGPSVGTCGRGGGTSERARPAVETFFWRTASGGRRLKTRNYLFSRPSARRLRGASAVSSGEGRRGVPRMGRIQLPEPGRPAAAAAGSRPWGRRLSNCQSSARPNSPLESAFPGSGRGLRIA